MRIDPTAVYVQSDLVTAKAIDDEFMIVPVTPVKNGRKEAIYLLNETSREIWERLNGETPLEQVVQDLVKRYNTATCDEICQDVWRIVEELSNRNIIKKV